MLRKNPDYDKDDIKHTITVKGKKCHIVEFFTAHTLCITVLLPNGETIQVQEENTKAEDYTPEDFEREIRDEVESEFRYTKKAKGTLIKSKNDLENYLVSIPMKFRDTHYQHEMEERVSDGLDEGRAFYVKMRKLTGEFQLQEAID